ncbi:hypothetical protein HYPSUDRAFT_179521 [Hypholoma sublateritium FD-334 SS-4]|uniref:Mitochondrial outer membrane transport complex Sam37/metaxin N-terminal domain-containing protein n=1 Tax=Hypholoma sublateritium (strain FD-334 SS-4) TaxID=945553 RepID=A0A0D2Q6T3_HYPSF|nr:hypothetical protein HYPSUDRAFT_179521 [Hypholoma sublateritium FD-334 SS-4]
MSSSSQTKHPSIILYIWPSQWELPSFDPLCLAAVLYLQLAIPRQFSVIECSSPDGSPTGQLPCLVHEQYAVALYPSIVKYISGLQTADFKTYPRADLDASLSHKEKAQKVAWHAHAESHLGDLVYHYLYSNQENWRKLTGTALASMFPVPQKYYVPQRIRDSYRERLLAAGLWKNFVEETAESPFPRDVKPLETKKELHKNPAISQAFERGKVLQKVQTELDIYQKLLDGKSFIFRNQLSSVDVLVAAHILLLTNPPYPDVLLKNLLVEIYPTLSSHAQSVFNAALGEGKSLSCIPPPSLSLWDVIPSWPKGHASKKQSTDEEIQYRKIRWGFFGLALGSLVTYLSIISPRPSVWQDAEDNNENNNSHTGTEGRAI